MKVGVGDGDQFIVSTSLDPFLDTQAKPEWVSEEEDEVNGKGESTRKAMKKKKEEEEGPSRRVVAGRGDPKEREPFPAAMHVVKAGQGNAMSSALVQFATGSSE